MYILYFLNWGLLNMEALKKLEHKFRKIGFEAEIDKEELCVQKGDWSDIDVLCELDELPKPEYDWRTYDDITGEKLFVIRHRTFLKGWW